VRVIWVRGYPEAEIRILSDSRRRSDGEEVYQNLNENELVVD
jgi:hypothetical protein